MRFARAVWRAVRLFAHAFAGMWTIKFTFPHCSVAEREQHVQRWAERLLNVMGITLDVAGEPLAPGPVLLVANHISWLDINVMHATRYCRFVSKSAVQHWPLIGTLASGAGTLYIERESRRDAMRVVHHVAERLGAGDVIAVFPEGTTGDGVTILPFHANLLQAAVSADAPVQPLAMRFIDSATGKTSFAPSFVGDETLVGSVWRTLLADGIVARVRVGSVQRSDGRGRRAWAADLQAAVENLRI